MSEATYWERRQQELNAACEKDEARLKDRLADYYRQEETRLQNEIAAYYTKYGSNNVAEYRQLLQQLSDSDYKLLMQRMDDFAKKYPEYAHLMPVRESIYKLDRLQGLQYVELFGKKVTWKKGHSRLNWLMVHASTTSPKTATASSAKPR